MHATPTTLGPLDRLPASVRHLLLAGLPVLLGWLASDVVPALQDKPGLAMALAVAVQAVTLWFTTVTRQYGAGQPRPWDDQADPDAPEDEDAPEAA